MPRRKESVGDDQAASGRLNTNQVVAANLRLARERVGWTQDFLAEQLTYVTGRKYTKATISAMERSAENDRRRLFDAHELVELARCFDLPVTWFLTPLPEHCDEQLDIVGEERGIDILDFVYGSDAGRRAFRERLEQLLTDGHRILFGAARAGFEQQGEAAYRAILDAETPDLVKELGLAGMKAVEIADKLAAKKVGESARARLGEPLESELDRNIAEVARRMTGEDR